MTWLPHPTSKYAKTNGPYTLTGQTEGKHMRTIYYRVPDNCPVTTYLIECAVLWIEQPLEHELIARFCAEDYWNHRDGWECTWPLAITLHKSEDGPEVARYVVSMEMEPSFSARLIKNPVVEGTGEGRAGDGGGRTEREGE